MDVVYIWCCNSSKHRKVCTIL